MEYRPVKATIKQKHPKVFVVVEITLAIVLTVGFVACVNIFGVAR